MKYSFQQPRPYWLNEGLALSQEPSYGTPSGHASAAMVFYMLLAGYAGSRRWWLPATLATLLMGLSRIYLGVHFPHDVLIGYLLGFLVLIGYLVWYRYGKPRLEHRILGQKLLVALAVPALFLLIAVGIYFLRPSPDLTTDWAAFLPDGDNEGIEGMVAGIAALVGFGIGFVLERSRLRFRTGEDWSLRVMRYLVGIIGLAILFFGLERITPTEPQWLELALRTVRYFLSTLWVGYYAPRLFVRLGLATAEPQTGIQVGLRTNELLKSNDEK